MTEDQWFEVVRSFASHLPEALAILAGSLQVAFRIKRVEQALEPLSAQVEAHEIRLTVLEDSPVRR